MMETYRKRPDLTEVPGSLRRKIAIYGVLDQHPSHTLDDDEQEKFVETASQIKRQVINISFMQQIYFNYNKFFVKDAATWRRF